MKTKFFTLLILLFSIFGYSQKSNCPCPEFSKWQRLMDKGKYEKAYELALDITTIKTDGPIGENVDHDHFQRQYGKTNCYLWYKAEALFKWGHLDWIRSYDVYHGQNEPKVAYKFRFYCIEYGKKLFTENSIEETLRELEWAWTVSRELDMEKCSETDLENNQVMFQLAELLGDVYTKRKDYKNALKYYEFYDSNKYSSEINSKIAFAKEQQSIKKE